MDISLKFGNDPVKIPIWHLPHASKRLRQQVRDTLRIRKDGPPFTFLFYIQADIPHYTPSTSSIPPFQLQPHLFQTPAVSTLPLYRHPNQLLFNPLASFTRGHQDNTAYLPPPRNSCASHARSRQIRNPASARNHGRNIATIVYW
jgi:hypothetical protein